MSCSRAIRAFYGQGSTLATCLIFGVQLTEHYREIANKLREAAASCQFWHPKGDIASRGTPRKPSQSSRPPGAIDDSNALGMMGAAAKLLLSLTITGAIALTAAPLSAKEYRSREVTREFQREHPCPSTGRTVGACPGYRKDHVIPLACGGPDAVSNLQWQTVAAAKAKDRWEMRTCGR
jgi:hypothetical protein